MMRSPRGWEKSCILCPSWFSFRVLCAFFFVNFHFYYETLMRTLCTFFSVSERRLLMESGSRWSLVLLERKIIVCSCLCGFFFVHGKKYEECNFHICCSQTPVGCVNVRKSKVQKFNEFEIDEEFFGRLMTRSRDMSKIFFRCFFVSVTSQIKLMMDQLSHLSLHFWLFFVSLHSLCFRFCYRTRRIV